MMKRAHILILTAMATSSFFSCSNSKVEEEKQTRAVVPVTVTSPRFGSMSECTELMATSAYLVKTVIKSPVTGYVEKCSVTPGDRVIKNQLLFQLRTKESEALQQDTAGSLNINGIIRMKASINGVIATIDHPQGDFLQEGDALATIVVPESLVFILEVPFEIKTLVRSGRTYQLTLPDNTTINASVRSVLPSMSGASQTQRIVMRPGTVSEIPENLMARVRIVRSEKKAVAILPKTCILSDEIMQNFWIMKMINDSVAIKISVRTGITGKDSVEVISPELSKTDRILSSGNYGLGDTVVVSVIRHE